MNYVKYVLKICLIAAMVIVPLTTRSGYAQSDVQIIRDTEIENVFKAWMEPLLKAADMQPGSVNLVLVQSPQINAFVAGGANIFIYTGLIEKTESPGGGVPPGFVGAGGKGRPGPAPQMMRE